MDLAADMECHSGRASFSLHDAPYRQSMMKPEDDHLSNADPCSDYAGHL